MTDDERDALFADAMNMSDEERRREYEALTKHLLAITANQQHLLTRDTDVTPRRMQLKGTPHGLQIIRETIEHLLATGDVWWSEEP